MNRNQLLEISRRIKGRTKAIEDLKKSLLDRGHELVCEVRLQGLDLLTVHNQTKRDEWDTWLANTMDAHDAKRCMALASSHPRIADLDDIGSMKQALLLFEQAEAPKELTKTWPAYIMGLSRLSKFRNLLLKVPITQWPQAGVEQLKEDLEPIVKQVWPEKFA